MAAHRYWRVYAECRQLSGSFVFGLAGIEMRAAPGGSILTGSGTILTPQATDSSLVPASAFDGDPATLWGRNGHAYVTPGYDFGTPVDVGEVRVVFGATGSARPGSTYSSALTAIEYSDDGLLWRRLAPLLDLTSIGDGGTAVFLLAEPEFRTASAILRLAPGVPVVPFRRLGALTRYDPADGGPYRVAGTVVIDGTPATPASRRVRLFDKISGRLVREQWSAADGTFEFAKVRVGPWLLVVDDYTLTYEADAATEVLAVL